MSLHDRIKEARIKKGLTQEQLGELVGVAKTTITGYEKNREPTAAKVGEIADALNVDANFLYQDEVRERKENNVSLEELSMIKKYRFISTHSPDGASVVDTVLDREYAIAEKLRIAGNVKSQHPVVEFDPKTDSSKRFLEYFHSASAGTGVFILGNEASEQIEIPDIDEYRNADYAIGVSGDSMEPDFHDGDIVLVSQNLELNHGDVGIFIINNQAYIKEYGETELISRNPSAGNIKISEYDNIVCMGKVVGKL